MPDGSSRQGRRRIQRQTLPRYAAGKTPEHEVAIILVSVPDARLPFYFA